jgi:hypothetical protein
MATKAQQWNHLSHELLTQRRRLFLPQTQTAPAGANANAVPAATLAGDDDNGVVLPPPKPSPEILVAITEKMLSVNPDPSHLWNIRREMLLYVQNATSQQQYVKKSSLALDIQAELALTAHCLQRNPKSYSAWYHRKWSLVYSLTHPTDDGGGSSSSTINSSTLKSTQQIEDKPHTEGHLMDIKTILISELELCAQFLQLDERNFHCWNYRRFVVALLGSCGGSGASSSSSTSSSARQDLAEGMVDKSDWELFTGSWSSWLPNQSTAVSMGAQSSLRGQKAMGNIPSHPEGHSIDKPGGKEAAHPITKSVIALSQEELDTIIINEWNFTTSKIHDNFSNGSAFHYRSKLLPLILESRLVASLDEEGNRNTSRYNAILELARGEWESILLNAIFTEPDDQTPWWYHRFIVSWIKPLSNSKNNEINNNSDGNDDDDIVEDEMLQECKTLLYEMADSLRELLEVEKENDVLLPPEGNDENINNKDESKGAKCKWAYIGLHLVLSTILELFASRVDDESVVDLRMEGKDCLMELMRIDPNRKERYQNLVADIERDKN